MSRRMPSSLIACALLALGWAQVFGLTRGYWCDCAGAGQVSMFDHCHGDHGQGCHHDDSPLHSHEGHEDDEEDTHEHAPVKVSLDAQVVVSVSVDGQAALPVEILSSSAAVVPVPMHEAAPATPPRPWVDEGRHWPRVLARAIALRI